MNNKPKPTCGKIAIGTDAFGDWVTMPVWERNTLLVGGVGSGRRFAGERVIGEVVRIPKEQRQVVIIDLKGGELAKWQRCADVFAVGMKEAAGALKRLWDITEARKAEARKGLITGDPEKYRSGLTPCEETREIVVFLNDLDTIARPLENDEEEWRRYAYFLLEKHLVLGTKFSGISFIVECSHPDPSCRPTPLRVNFSNRLVAHVDTPHESDMVLGTGISSSGIDASRLTNHWMFASIGGKGLTHVRAVGEPDGSDLQAIANNPQYFAESVRPDARSEAVNKQFLAEHEQNLRDGFTPVGAISVSAGEEDQAEFDKAVVKEIRKIERGEQGS